MSNNQHVLHFENKKKNKYEKCYGYEEKWKNVSQKLRNIKERRARIWDTLMIYYYFSQYTHF